MIMSLKVTLDRQLGEVCAKPSCVVILHKKRLVYLLRREKLVATFTHILKLFLGARLDFILSIVISKFEL